MTQFNDKSFCDLLFKCYKTADYKACILFSNLQTFTDFTSALVRYDLNGIEGVSNVQVMMDRGTISFENGSTISLRIASYDLAGELVATLQSFSTVLFESKEGAKIEFPNHRVDDSGDITLEEFLGVKENEGCAE